ncbi:MAG: carbohydrate porin [Gammaproteobacteria bacterium]|nr:carbohydrate porin [Gammaproteobacteria bacterium]
MNKTKLSLALGALLTTGSFSVQAATNMQLEERIKALEAGLDATATAVEQSGSTSKTTIGGYGELHYNNLDKNGTDSKKIDFHRFVLFFAHEFNEDIRFFSEMELEHSIAGESKAGEVELEQAYIEFDINDTTQVTAGLFLVPVGIINETHEPPTFYGVERNPVEKNIIPATWWEAGAGISGQIGDAGLSYDLAYTSGLKVDATTVSIRGGRQKVSKADAESFMIAARLKYTGIAGLELAGTLISQNDMSQDKTDTLGGGKLLEMHAVWNTGPVTLKALHAQWDIDGAAPGQDDQNGRYFEASYKVSDKLGVFARANQWEVDSSGKKKQNDFGVNYWPHEDVVIKFDVQQQNSDAGNADGYNIGVGYQF